MRHLTSYLLLVFNIAYGALLNKDKDNCFMYKRGSTPIKYTFSPPLT